MFRDSPARRSFLLFGAALSAVLLAALVAIPAVASFGARSDGRSTSVEDASPADAETVEMIPLTPDPADFVSSGERSQASFYRLSDGMQIGTANERKARPALSLIKLYIAKYVLDNGTLEESYDALQMLVDSNDRFAAELYRSYPDSVDAVAEEYALYSTRGAEQWGYSVTSTYDAVTFISQLMVEDPTHPILTAMSVSTEIAADGYEQDFGTAQLPGALGTKWGWSDDRDLHSSVSFGRGWVAAASVVGSAEDLTQYAEAQLEGPAKTANSRDS